MADERSEAIEIMNAHHRGEHRGRNFVGATRCPAPGCAEAFDLVADADHRFVMDAIAAREG